MKLTFCGAARAVTGSCHLLEACGKRILIDCGLQQGRDEFDNTSFPFDPGQIDHVLVTHAHIDHSGRLPMLYRLGYQGKVTTTRQTAYLLRIMLLDSAHIQESDAEYQNKKNARAGRALIEPIYTTADAFETFDHIDPHDYEQSFTLCPGIRCRFIDAGHLLGSAFIELTVTENGREEKLLFSGDIGNEQQPIIRDPSPIIGGVDYVVMESTYGNRDHEGEGEYVEGLAEVIESTVAQGGNIIIPAFAVGRTQEILYFIREIKQRGLVPSMPNFPVYVDSPLALEATRIFAGDLTGYIDEEARDLVQDGINILTFPELHLCHTVDESKALNTTEGPKVIISASGMCDAGRIRHHLKHNLWKPEATVVFVGYQSEGSLGRALLDGKQTVKIFGEEISVRARIVNFHGLSSHADRETLLNWVTSIDPKPKHVFVVHGDPEVAPFFASSLVQSGLPAHAPELGEIYDLTANRMVLQGQTPVRKKKGGSSQMFIRLTTAGKQLLALIERCKGMANRDLEHFEQDIKKLIKKWQR